MKAALPPLLALLGSSCTGEADDTSGDPGWEPARTVILVTVDTLRADFLWGHDEGWNTAPNLLALFEEGVLLRDVQAARNLTGPALASILTGTYPRDHKMRGYGDSAPAFPTIQERFQDAGWRTLGFAANMCSLLSYGFDQAECTGELDETVDDYEAVKDDIATHDLVGAIGALDPEEPVFAWLHLNQVHSPYLVVQTWYDEFHPETYEGALDVTDVQALEDIQLGLRDVTEEELRHLRAVYASEVRAMDERMGGLIADLKELGRWDDAVFAFGADHGEELCDHFNYVSHGCSPYQPVTELAFAFRAPGRLPAGLALDGWVSQTDVAPTLVDLASAFEWTGFVAGRSLVDEILAGTLDDPPAFFERGLETVGLAWQGHRFMLSGEEGYDECGPYNGAGTVFPSELRELYDLESDPGERTNLAKDPAFDAFREEVTDRVCDWVEERPWVGTDEMMESNLVVQACAER